MKSYSFYSVFFVLSLFGGFVFRFARHPHFNNLLPALADLHRTALAAIATPSFAYHFNAQSILEESGSMQTSASPYWWLNSGGRFYIENGVGKTIQGVLAPLSRWRMSYNLFDPIDTDRGTHPQNIFRLLTRSKWNNFQEQVYFKITKDILSSSPNRNESNGISLFSRYQDSNNLYYTTIRVDGAVAIKKKKDGVYHTIAYEPFLPDPPYSRETNPDLLPKDIWIGLRSDIHTNPDNTVTITLSLDGSGWGNWLKILEATDDGVQYGGAPFLREGYAGIRTDFMEVEFDDFLITNR